MAGTPRVADFDAWRAEHSLGEGPQLKIGGKLYQLPPSLPAAVTLEVARLTREQGEDAEVPPDKVAQFVRDIIGPAYDEIMREVQPPLGLSELEALLQHVVGLYDGSTGGPNRAARRSSAKRPRAAATT